jgi:hypothetical protein
MHHDAFLNEPIWTRGCAFVVTGRGYQDGDLLLLITRPSVTPGLQNVIERPSGPPRFPPSVIDVRNTPWAAPGFVCEGSGPPGLMARQRSCEACEGIEGMFTPS